MRHHRLQLVGPSDAMPAAHGGAGDNEEERATHGLRVLRPCTPGGEDPMLPDDAA